MPKPKRPRKIIDFHKVPGKVEDGGFLSDSILYRFTSQETPNQRIRGMIAQNPATNKVRILHIGTERKGINPNEEWSQVEWTRARNSNSIGHLRGLYEDLKTFIPDAKGNFFGHRATGAHYRAYSRNPNLINVPQTSWRRKERDLKGIE